jgi:hypothetical protein
MAQDCQIFLGTTYQNGKIINQITYKIYHMSVKYTQKPLHIPTSSIASPSKIYPNYDFWLENMPSGNPGMASNVRFQFFRFLDDSSEDKLKGQFIKAAEFSCRHFLRFLPE